MTDRHKQVIDELTALLRHLDDTYRKGTVGELAVRTLAKYIRERIRAYKSGEVDTA